MLICLGFFLNYRINKRENLLASCEHKEQPLSGQWTNSIQHWSHQGNCKPNPNKKEASFRTGCRKIAHILHPKIPALIPFIFDILLFASLYFLGTNRAFWGGKLCSSCKRKFTFLIHRWSCRFYSSENTDKLFWAETNANIYFCHLL